jgi:hypothetical protein
MGCLYEKDFHNWALDQAARIRRGEPIDGEHVAEELESLGKGEQNRLESHLIVLFMHMLKWDYQADHRSRSWDLTIKEQRRQTRRVLKQNPSLQPLPEETIQEAYRSAVTHAAIETGLDVDDFPTQCPYAPEDLVSEE